MRTLLLPCLPTRSAITQRPSRCCRCANSRAQSSPRRNPAPSSTLRMARSRLPFVVPVSGSASNSSACCRVSQLPRRTPLGCGPAVGPEAHHLRRPGSAPSPCCQFCSIRSMTITYLPPIFRSWLSSSMAASLIRSPDQRRSCTMTCISLAFLPLGLPQEFIPGFRRAQ